MRYFWLIFLLFASNALAAVRYVDNTVGCPGSGTSGAPWCSIQQALTSMAGGDDIKIRSGTGVYSETASISAKSGSSGSPSILEPDTGANFVIRNTASAQFNASIKVKESDYWEFRNLTFDANSVSPSMVALHVQCETKNCVGIVVDGSSFKNWRQPLSNTQNAAGALYIAGCTAQLGGCGGVDRNLTATITNNTFTSNDATSIYLLHASGTISNNTISDQRCGPWDSGNGVVEVGIYNNYDGNNLTISNNILHDFAPWSNCPRTLPLYPTMAAYWCDDGGHTTTIDSNTIYNLDVGGNPTNANRGSNGIFVEAGCESHTVTRNVIYNLTQYAMTQSYHSLNKAQSPNFFDNNTVFNVGWGFELKEGIVSVKNNIIKNATQASFCLGCTSGSPSLVTLTMDYNLYDDGGSQTKIADYQGVGILNLANWRTRCGCDARSASTNPLFVSTVTPDFHLQSGSPARGAADPTVGLGTDLGALPFASGGTITWANSRTGGIGTGAGAASWTITGIPLLSGVNPITVTATDSSGNAGAASITVTYAPPFPGNTMAGAWDWMEGSGTSSTDHSGNGNTASMPNGPTLNGSGSLVLNGANQYAVVSGSLNNSLNYTQSFTFDIWINLGNFHTDYRSLIEKSGGATGSPYALWASNDSCIGPSGKVVTDGGFTPPGRVCDPNPLQVGVWTYLALTYDGANLKLYRNGVLDQTFQTTGYIEPTNGSLGIGAYPNGSQSFDGTISRTRTYNYAIPVSYGSNTVPGAFPCTAQNFADNAKQSSIIGDMNCPIVAPVPPLTFQMPASASALVTGPSSTALSIGNVQ